MNTESEVRRRLGETAGRLSAEIPPVELPIRRGRRRRAARVTAYALVAVVLVAGLSSALSGLGGLHRGGLRLPDGRTIQVPQVTSTVELPDVSVGVAVGDGSVWAASLDGSSVYRVDPGSGRVVATVHLPTPGAGSGLAFGEGGLWVPAGPEVFRIDPATDRISARIALPELSFGTPQAAAIAVGDGSVWVSTARTTPVVLRIDPGTNHVVATIRMPHWTLGITSAYGSIWTSSCDWDQVYRIDPASNRIAATVDIPDAGLDPLSICMEHVAAGGGSVWVVVPWGALWRIDPQANAVRGRPTRIDVGVSGGLDRAAHASPPRSWVKGLAVFDGIVLVVHQRDAELATVVSLVDATTGRVVGKPVPVGRSASEIVPGAGSLWVPGLRSGTPAGVLFEIAP